MLEPEEVVHIILLSTMTISAILANALYMFIVKAKTPKSLSSYASILFNIACVDFLAAFCSFMCIASLQYVGGGRMVPLYLGPCTAISAQWCHRLFVGHANFVIQSVLLLLTSFAYRLWILKTDSERQLRHGKWWTVLRMALLALGIPNTVITIDHPPHIIIFLIHLLLSFVGKYEVPGLSSNRIISVFDMSGGLTDNWLTRIAIANNLTTYFVGFMSIFVLRRKLFTGIVALSSSDRYNHQMIYRSLTAQMMLPLAYVLGTSLWLLDMIGIVHSQTLQRSILILSSLFALFSPLINMYYIPPYRKYINSLFCVNSQAVKDVSQFSTTIQLPETRF